jgi:DNA-binding NarL/FixJ family response regulator
VAAANGGAPLAPTAASFILKARRQRGSVAEMSRREREVVQFVAAGLTNGQIAKQLGLSEKTVKVHLGRAFQRIGVSDRHQAAEWAERHGLSPQSTAAASEEPGLDEPGLNPLKASGL